VPDNGCEGRVRSFHLPRHSCLSVAMRWHGRDGLGRAVGSRGEVAKQPEVSQSGAAELD